MSMPLNPSKIKSVPTIDRGPIRLVFDVPARLWVAYDARGTALVARADDEECRRVAERYLRLSTFAPPSV